MVMEEIAKGAELRLLNLNAGTTKQKDKLCDTIMDCLFFILHDNTSTQTAQPKKHNELCTVVVESNRSLTATRRGNHCSIGGKKKCPQEHCSVLAQR